MTNRWSHTVIGDSLGAIVDADLSKDFTDSDKAQLQELYEGYSLLVFKGPRISRPRQIEIMSVLGPVLTPEQDYDVAVVSNEPDGALGADPLLLHSDIFFGEPYLGISLHALDVVPGKTSTIFASTTRAYRSLPERLKTRLDGIQALHVSPLNSAVRNRAADVPSEFPRTVRDVAFEHPITGEKMLFLIEMGLDSLPALAEPDSESLIQELLPYLSAPSNVYEHWWENGDLLMWDNMKVLHGRPASASLSQGKRVLQRVALGERGISEQFPTLPMRDEDGKDRATDSGARDRFVSQS